MSPEYNNNHGGVVKSSKNKLLVVIAIFVVLLVACLVTFLEIDRRSFKEVTTNSSASSTNSTSSNSSGGTQGKGQDSESRSDISAIHSQIEAYYAQNGFYPGLVEMNSLPFIEANLVSLATEALQTPTGTTKIFTEGSTALNYGYKATLCNKSGKECQKYVLSALLNTGEKYTKEALN